MVVTVSHEDLCSIRALAVLATADQWTKGHTKDGRPFFVVPGSKGRIYWTDTRACSCPEARERGATCKHVLAVRMWTLANTEKAPAMKPAPAACRVCTAELPAGMLAGKCGDCAELDDLFEGAAVITAAFGSDAGAVVRTFGGAR